MGYLEEQLNNQQERLKFLEKEREKLLEMNKFAEDDSSLKEDSAKNLINKIDEKINKVYSELSVIKIRKMMATL